VLLAQFDFPNFEEPDRSLLAIKLRRYRPGMAIIHSIEPSIMGHRTSAPPRIRPRARAPSRCSTLETCIADSPATARPRRRLLGRGESTSPIRIEALIEVG